MYLKYHLVKITNITNIIILDHPSKLQIYNSATESNTKKYNKYNTKLSEAKSCRDRNYQRVKKYWMWYHWNIETFATKKLGTRSHHITLRESIFINKENMGSYSYWNRTYSKLEKINTYVGQDNQVSLENFKAVLKRFNYV